jgi:Transposase zinc-binding domain/Putative transposase
VCRARARPLVEPGGKGGACRSTTAGGCASPSWAPAGGAGGGGGRHPPPWRRHVRRAPSALESPFDITWHARCQARRVPTSARRSPLPAPAAEYVPRKPQDTLLHRLVREHYATFVAHTEATYAAPLPRYVTDAFERYLACGDFSQGFVRCHCDACRRDVLVAFSCKQRGLCPSCGARRMCDVAANVTDAIFPSAPVRQWVLSLPFELRVLSATKPDVLTALGRIFSEEVARATKRLAGVAGAETGSISFPQRFGSSLNLHVHFHLLAVDAVFEKHGEGVRIHEAPPPAKTDVALVACTTARSSGCAGTGTSTSVPPRTAATSPLSTRPSTPSRASRSGAARS